MPTNERRTGAPFYSSFQQRPATTRPPTARSSTTRSWERRRSRDAEHVTTHRDKPKTVSPKISEPPPSSKKWACDICQKIFDDYQVAIRHEDACRLKSRLEKLDYMARKSSSGSSSHSKTNEAVVPESQTIGSTTRALNDILADSTKDNHQRERQLGDVPRTIHVQKALLQPSLPPSELESSTSYYARSDSYSNSTGLFQQQGYYSVSSPPICGGATDYHSQFPRTSTTSANPVDNRGSKQNHERKPVYTCNHTASTQQKSWPGSPNSNEQAKRDDSLQQQKTTRIRHPQPLPDNFSHSRTIFSYSGPPSSHGRSSHDNSHGEARDDIPSVPFRTRIPKAKDVKVIVREKNREKNFLPQDRRVRGGGDNDDNDGDDDDDDEDEQQPKKKSMKWLCDVCKEAQFENYVDAFRHEMRCRKQFFLDQNQRDREREKSMAVESEPLDRYYSDRRAERRERLKQEWYEKSKSIYSKLDSDVPEELVPPAADNLREGGVERATHTHKSEGETKKWLCSICKQEYFEHYLDACRHEKECVMTRGNRRAISRPKHSRILLPRPTLKDRRESYA